MPWLQGNAGINIWSVFYWVYSHFDHLFVNLHTLRCVIWSKMGEFQQASYIQYQCRKYLRHTPWTSVPVSSRSVSKGESVREEILSSHPEMDVCFVMVFTVSLLNSTHNEFKITALQKRVFDPMVLIVGPASVCDAGPTINQHWFTVSRLR